MLHPIPVFLLALASTLALNSAHAAAPPATISYQGYLTDPSGNSPVSGTKTIDVALYDAATGGNLRFSETHSNVSVTNGRFSLLLGSVGANFASVDFTEALWLQLTVGTEMLAPRIPFATVPYARGTLQIGAQADGKWCTSNGSVISCLQDPPPSLTSTATISGDWDNSANPWSDGEVSNVLTLTGGSISNTPINNAIIGGTTPAAGTFTTLRATSMIGGHSGNAITSGVTGGFIGGGGGLDPLFNTVINNTVTDSFGVVSGGNGNQAGDNAGSTSDKPNATVAGGFRNTASGKYSAVSGGGFNTASGLASTVSGGDSNTANRDYSAIAGGSSNTASGNYSAIAGGYSNTANGSYSAVVGGHSSSAGGDFSLAAGLFAKVASNHPGTFLWADSSFPADFNSASANEFAARATGGVRFVAPFLQLDGADKGVGKVLTSDANGRGTWQTPSVSGTAITGTIAVSQGGTGATSLTGYVKGNGGLTMTANPTVPGSDISGDISGNAANVTSTVTVSHGGTGATSLAGYLFGNGTSAVTASATIPASAISGSFGTLRADTIIGGHSSNTVSAGVRGAFIGGGGSGLSFAEIGGPNLVVSDYGVIGGGEKNQAGNNEKGGEYSTVAGGYGNTASRTGSTVAGGGINTASGKLSAVAGGYSNTASAGYSAVAGGFENAASGNNSAVAGGQANAASAEYSAVAGGKSNVASGVRSIVAGGAGNQAIGYASAILGGEENKTAAYSVVPGGYRNDAFGDFSFAGGRQAKVNAAHDGTFLWSGSQASDFTSTIDNEFAVRATGGVRLVAPFLQLDNANKGAGKVLTSDANGKGTWQTPTISAANITGTLTDVQVPDNITFTTLRADTIIGGHSSNSVTAGVTGAFIGGGGNSGNENTISDNYSVVAGGENNSAGSGDSDITNARYATVGGGGLNGAHNISSTVAGGYSNTAAGQDSTIPGGSYNLAAGDYSFAAGHYAKIGASHDGTFLWSDGTATAANTFTSAAANEFAVRASGGMRFLSGSTAWRMTDNLIIGGYSGNSVTAGVTGAFIGAGGSAGTATINLPDDSSVTLPLPNSVTDNFSTVGGGQGNRAGDNAGTATDRRYSTVAGGAFNRASGLSSTVGGGYFNQAIARDSAIPGGSYNTASGGFSTVAGGTSNTASGENSAVAGGYSNTASGAASTVAGGVSNTASGYISFAAGIRAKAIHDNSFVWSDGGGGGLSEYVSFSSNRDNSFSVLATGGVKFITGVTKTIDPLDPLRNAINLEIGAALLPGTGVWLITSDRNTKQDFAPVNGREVLEKVAAMPIQTWSYKTEAAHSRHMGPMAQDFRAAFQLGNDDKTIATIDPDGVALAAIQGLNALLQEQRKLIETQQAAMAAQQAEITALKSANQKVAERLQRMETRFMYTAR